MPMDTKYLDVDDSWGVIICYDFHPLDEYEMRQNMMAFGLRGERIENAIDILFKKNTGLCITRPDIRMCLIFVGNATDEEQWWDTLTHELYHAQDAICDYYNVRKGSEDAAWLMGYLMRQAVKIISEPCKD